MEKPCGCKGIRYCLVCDPSRQLINKDTKPLQNEEVFEYKYCFECQKAWLGDEQFTHPNHGTESVDFPGITLLKDFVTEEEEQWLDQEINKTIWVNSQSGRRKQDYGPKVNFKKKKLKTATFTGLPNFSKSLISKMQEFDILKTFIPVELCNLEYIPDRGSAIDPHFDDFWVWGERLVTLNLLSRTVYTMTLDSRPDVFVTIPFPRRSLIVMHGPARYQWKHSIRRKDISERRLALTFRELTPEFLDGGTQEKVGDELIKTALNFSGTAVVSGTQNESTCQ